MIQKGDKVKYVGSNRPYLNDRIGSVMGFTDGGKSASVIFPEVENLTKRTEYVGVNYLKVVDYPQYSPAYFDDLTNKLDDELKVAIRDRSDAQVRIDRIYKKIDAITSMKAAVKTLESE